MNVSRNESGIMAEFHEGAYLVWGVAVTYTVNGLTSILTNSLILNAVAKEKKLSSKCYQFMGNLALADMISSSEFVVNGMMVFLGFTAEEGGTPVSNRVCFYTHIPYPVSFTAGSFMILAIGCDRLFALSQPLVYSGIPQRRYVWTVNVSAWIFGLPFFIVGLMNVNEGLIPACCLPTSLAGPALSLWVNVSLCINFAVVIVYSAAIFFTKRLSSAVGLSEAQSWQNERTARVMKSLVVVMAVFCCSWFLTMVVLFTSSFFNPVTQFHFAYFAGILATFNVGSNFFVYFARSEEFRKFYIALFSKGWAKVSGNSMVAPVAYTGAVSAVSNVPRGLGKASTVSRGLTIQVDPREPGPSHGTTHN